MKWMSNVKFSKVTKVTQDLSDCVTSATATLSYLIRQGQNCLSEILKGSGYTDALEILVLFLQRKRRSKVTAAKVFVIQISILNFLSKLLLSFPRPLSSSKLFPMCIEWISHRLEGKLGRKLSGNLQIGYSPSHSDCVNPNKTQFVSQTPH